MQRILTLTIVAILITGLVASAQYPAEKPRGVRPPSQLPPRAGSIYAPPSSKASSKPTAKTTTQAQPAPTSTINRAAPSVTQSPSVGSEPFNPFGAIRDENVVPVADTSQPAIRSTAPRKTVARPAIRAAAPNTRATSEPAEVSTETNNPPPQATAPSVSATPRTAALEKRPEVLSPGKLLPSNSREPQPLTSEEPAPASIKQPTISSPPITTPATTSATAANNRFVLTRRAPALSVEATGPKRITVGKETIYNVSLRNQGDEPAENVLVLVGLPTGVEIQDAQTTAGTAGASTDAAQPGIEWRVSRVGPQSKLDLNLKLVARQSQPFDLSLQWICSPAGAQAAVEVEEPRLQVAISGPNEVIFGQPHTYKLTVSNPGNGAAENATIYLLPLDPREGQAASQNLGTLTAGASRSVEIELVPRQNGQVTIQAEATADGGLKTATQYAVRIRRGDLRVAVTGPRTVLAGVPAQYEVRVQNPGDAPAKRVQIVAQLPTGAEVLTVSQQGQHLQQRNEVAWTLDQLPAGSEQVFNFKTVMRSGGSHRVATTANAEGELHSTAEVATNVAAYPDLTLEVNDSPGPIALGQPVTYEIRVRNRGAGAAEGLDLTAYFSEGIDPTQVEGAAGEIGAGVVTIRPNKSLGPNGELVYRVKARATTAGQHKIRVELGCQNLGAKLTQEDTTLFYSDEPESSVPANPLPMNNSGPTTPVPNNAGPLIPSSTGSANPAAPATPAPFLPR